MEDLQASLDDYTRELTAAEQSKRDAIYIKIGKDIKIEITGDQYKKVSSLTAMDIVNRLTDDKSTSDEVDDTEERDVE